MTSRFAADPATPATKQGAPSPFSGVRSTPSVSSDPATDGRTEELRSLTRRLAAVAWDLSGDPITGKPLERLEDIAALHLDHADDVVAFAATLKAKGMRKWGGLLAALDGWSPTPTAPAQPKCELCGVYLRAGNGCLYSDPACPRSQS